MNKIILTVCFILFCFSGSYSQQHVIKIHDNSFYKNLGFKAVDLIDSDTKQIFLQNGLNYVNPNRSGDILKYVYGSGFKYFNNGFFNSVFVPNPPFWNCFPVNYFTVSNQDSNLYLQTHFFFQGFDGGDATFITYNGGDTAMWLEQFSNSFLGILCAGYDINPLNDSIIYIAYADLQQSSNIFIVHKTTDRGFSWFPLDTLSNLNVLGYSLDDPNGFLTIVPFDTSRIFLSGFNNMKLSTNSGNDFFDLTIPPLDGLLFNKSNNSILGYSRFKLYKSTDSGISWDSVEVGFRIRSLTLKENSADMLFAGTDNGIRISENGGGNWRLYNNFFSPSRKVMGLTQFKDGNDTLMAATDDAVYLVSGEQLIDTISPQYFPLQVGNKWVYREYDLFNSYYNKYEITKDTTIAGTRYFKFMRNNIFQSWIRYDSLSTNLLSYAQGDGCSIFPNDKIIDSLGSSVGDVLDSCINGLIFTRNCIDTGQAMIFDSSFSYKEFGYDGLTVGNGKYAKGIGLISSCAGEPPPCSYFSSLKGCIIGGELYGDTVMLDNYEVAGTVKFVNSGNAVSGGYVKAVKFSPVTAGIVTLDSVQIGINGRYILKNVPVDSVDIVAYPNSEKQADFVPTYYPSSIHWANSTKIYVSNDIDSINIKVHPIVSSVGNNNISGNVYALPPSSPVNPPLNGAVIYLKSEDMFKSYNISDSEGYFKIDSIANGNYLMLVDRLGFSTDSTYLEINNDNVQHDFYLQQVIVKVNLISSIVPESFYLYQNYPNPFNPVTKIKFDLPLTSKVRVTVFDLLGRQISQVLDRELQAGVHELSFDASSLPTGVYFYTVEAGNYIGTKKMLVLK